MFMTVISYDAISQTGRGIGADTGTLEAPAMLRLWNWPDTTFLLGSFGSSALRDATGNAEAIWPFLDGMGLSLYIPNYYRGSPVDSADSVDALRYYDTLAWTADVAKGHRIARLELREIGKDIAAARAIEFYPFDSTQSPYYPFRFTSVKDTVYGESAFNQEELGADGSRLREQVYKLSNTSPGTVIAEHIAFNQWDNDSSRIYRFRSQGASIWDDNVQNVRRWLDERRGSTDTMFYAVVAGHLFSGGTSNLSDSLLKVEILYEVPTYHVQLDPYVFHTGAGPATSQSPVDTIFPVKTFYITKNDLYPTGSSPLNWNQYREVILPFDLRFLENGAWGPTHPDAADTVSRRFDIKVTWLGGEPLALRSVSLRDIRAQLVLGTDATAIAWRQKRINLIRRILYGEPGTNYNPPQDSLRRAHIGIYPGEEQVPTEYAGLAYLTQMLRDTFNFPRPGGAPGERDSVGTFTAQYFLNDMFHQHHLATPKFVGVETYLWTLPLQGGDSTQYKNFYNLRYEEMPSIREENGGRFGIAEIDLDDPTSIEEYEKTFQRSIVGRYMPSWNNVMGLEHKRKGFLHHLGDAARISRATGRRLIQLPSVNANMDFQLYQDAQGVWQLDTMVGHFPTEAELRMVTNLGLAYGSKGAVYWALTSSANNGGLIVRDKNDGTNDKIYGTSIYINGGKNSGNHIGGGFGPIGSSWQGQYTGDTMVNKTNWTIHNGTSQALIELPDFYVGFQSRTQAMRNVNQRLKKIGRKMMDLTWRESYSVHHTAQWPTGPGMQDFTSRPFKSNELIQDVRAWDPRTLAVDSAWQTYVELGYFDKKAGATSQLDTHYIMVVNRRTFERPDWIVETTARGRKMDSLSENRTIELEFNLPLPDTTTADQYNVWWRIREVEPPTTPLALIGARQPLDTAVRGGTQKVLLTLPPGEGTLLEILFAAPDETLHKGNLARNGQRKLLHNKADNRYYSCYHRFDSAIGDWDVFFRRSLPVTATGTILWEPIEHRISDSLVYEDESRIDNQYPSMTFRIDGADTIISIVWDSHGLMNPVGTREILLRDIIYSHTVDQVTGDTIPYTIERPIQSVAFHAGPDPDEWGTPVINSSSGTDLKEYIAWSDEAVGIVAVGRLNNQLWTPYDTLNEGYVDMGYAPGQFPSVPPFSHREMQQNNCPIVWQQPGANNYIGIAYQRLGYTPPPAGPKLLVTNLNMFWISDEYPSTPPLKFANPSIDQSQDGLGQVMEGVSWERVYYPLGGQSWHNEIFFQSLLYDSSTSQSSLVGGALRHIASNMMGIPSACYPVVSSENQIMTPADSNQIPLFAITYEQPIYPQYLMRLLEAKWIHNATAQWVNNSTPPWKQTPRQYWYYGEHPNGASSEGNIENRYAILYARPSDSALRTSRRYFARQHTNGYQAHGREISMQLENHSGINVVASLYDVWMSDSKQGKTLEFITYNQPDSLSQLLALLQTETFSASDSLELGWIVAAGMFAENTADMNGKSITCLTELVNSSTGEVVHVLDSSQLKKGHQGVYMIRDTIVSVLPGKYFVRIRPVSHIFTSNLILGSRENWSIGRINGWVESPVDKRQVGKTEKDIHISAQPNPTTGDTELRFSIRQSENVTLRIYNALGQEVTTIIDQQLYPAGHYSAKFNGEDLTPGAYIIELKTFSKRVTAKLLLQR